MKKVLNFSKWNRLLKVSFITIIFGVALFSIARAEKPIVTAESALDKTSVYIGEKITYTVTIKAPQDAEIEAVDLEKNLSSFNIKDFGSKNTAFFGKKTRVLWYVINTYTLGKQTIPKAVIKYRLKNDSTWKEIEAREQVIEVKSSLGVDSTGEIKDIKSFVRLVSRWPFILILCLLALAAALAVIWFIRKRRHLKALPKKPAHLLAIEKLEALRQKELVRQGKFKEYFSELTDIVREYLENRFGLNAPRMSTEEFLNYARDAQGLSREQKSLLKEFLNAADMVKFAKYLPDAKDSEEAFQAARRFIDETKEVVEEVKTK